MLGTLGEGWLARQHLLGVEGRERLRDRPHLLISWANIRAILWPKGTSGTIRDAFCLSPWEVGRECYWHTVGGVQGCCCMCSDASDSPTTKNCLAPNVSSAEDEKPWVKLLQWELLSAFFSCLYLCSGRLLPHSISRYRAQIKMEIWDSNGMVLFLSSSLCHLSCC